MAVPPTAMATRSAMSAPMRATLLFRVIACEPPPPRSIPVSCTFGARWSLARTTPSCRRSRPGLWGGEPSLEEGLPVAEAFLVPSACLYGIAALDCIEDGPGFGHGR